MHALYRGRFLKLHVGDIPEPELAEILEKRCAIAPSYAAKLVAVMRELERRRQVTCLPLAAGSVLVMCLLGMAAATARMFVLPHGAVFQFHACAAHGCTVSMANSEQPAP